MIVVTGCQILRLKCTKVDFGWGSAPDPADLREHTSKGREGRGWEGKGMEGRKEERGREKMGKGGKGEGRRGGKEEEGGLAPRF